MSITYPTQQPIHHLSRLVTWIAAVTAIVLIGVISAMAVARLVQEQPSGSVAVVATAPAGTTLAGLRAGFAGRGADEAVPLPAVVAYAPQGSTLAGLREQFATRGTSPVILAAVVPTVPAGTTLAGLRAGFHLADPVAEPAPTGPTSDPWRHYQAEI